jgi:hypothetical protein
VANLKINPAAFPATLSPNAIVEIAISNVAIIQLQVDPRVSPQASMDWTLFQIFQALAQIDIRLSEIETVIGAMPGCGRPVDGLPSLMIATDAMRDALVAIHDRIDARAAAMAAAVPAPDPSAD